MDISGTQYVNINDVTQIIEDYNENIRYYNRNIRDLIEIYRDIMPRRRNRSPILNNIETVALDYLNTENTPVSLPPPLMVPSTTTETVNTPIITTPTVPTIRHNRQPYITNDRISYPIIYNPYRNSIFTTTNRTPGRLRRNIFNVNDLENVVVRPNNDQIRNATEIMQYNTTDFSQRRCPITLEAFEYGQEIRRINYCGHIFDNTALIEWFERNVRCPVCRHDIRDVEMTRVVSDNSGNTNTTISNIIQYGSDSEEEEEDRRETSETTQSQTSDSRDDTTTMIRDYLRDVLTTVINDNRFPELNSSVNSIFTTYNIPFILDISYTSI